MTRTARRAKASPEAVRRSLHFVELTADIVERAALLDPPELRTLDAIHLASALSLSDSLDVFVCYDEVLQRAAGAYGLTLAAPGA